MSVRYTCGLFLIDSRDKILLVHPTGHRPDSWSIPKGVAEVGEDFFDAAWRELREETGLDLKAYLPAMTQVRPLPPFAYGKANKTLVPFAIWLDRDMSDVHLYCESMVDEKFPENDDFQWVSLPELLPLVHHTQYSAAQLLKSYY
jgi:8-oxo-dGTP pyrophosphatase MutT (NUDIX family)